MGRSSSPRLLNIGGGGWSLGRVQRRAQEVDRVGAHQGEREDSRVAAAVGEGHGAHVTGRDPVAAGDQVKRVHLTGQSCAEPLRVRMTLPHSPTTGVYHTMRGLGAMLHNAWAETSYTMHVCHQHPA